jgi:hypothetical protein
MSGRVYTSGPFKGRASLAGETLNVAFKPGKQNLPPGYDLGTWKTGVVFTWHDGKKWNMSETWTRDTVVDKAWEHYRARQA